MLSFIIWFPILLAIGMLLFPIRNARLARGMALGTMIATLLAALHVFYHLPEFREKYAYEVRFAWAPGLGISYHLGVEGLGAMLVLLTTLVGTAAVAATRVTQSPSAFYALGLLMVGGMAGAFASLDLFFIYIFHEFALIPTFLLVGLWGTDLRRKAAMKITLYLGLGSLILLVGLLALPLASGTGSFDLVTLKNHFASHPLPQTVQTWIFGALFIGFGILLSVFPFHTWAPIGYGEAPALASMLHAGVIKKFGFYGLLVVAAPLLPAGFATWKPCILLLVIGNLIYCGYVAMRQTDLRYMLAYASISHMGYGLLALVSGTALSLQGLTLFLFAHGLTAALGFALVNHCREQTGTTEISELGGLATYLPLTATLFTMTAFAACGLPGLANFPAELMIFFGSFLSNPVVTIAAIWTAVITAVYFLRAVRNVFFGEASTRWSRVQDIQGGAKVAMIFLAAALIIVGFWPDPILGQATTDNAPSKTMEASILERLPAKVQPSCFTRL